jgi:hypothetical protein
LKEQDMPGDSTLEIEVVVFGKEVSRGINKAFLLAVAYDQTSSQPPIDGIVDVTGNIDLTKFPTDPAGNQAVDITFKLKSMVLDKRGNLVPVAWAPPAANAFKATPANTGEMTAKLIDSHTLLLDNSNSDGKKYRYSLSILADGVFKVPWTFDPEIGNKPRPPL